MPKILQLMQKSERLTKNFSKLSDLKEFWFPLITNFFENCDRTKSFTRQTYQQKLYTEKVALQLRTGTRSYA